MGLEIEVGKFMVDCSPRSVEEVLCFLLFS